MRDPVQPRQGARPVVVPVACYPASLPPCLPATACPLALPPLHLPPRLHDPASRPVKYR